MKDIDQFREDMNKLECADADGVDLRELRRR